MYASIKPKITVIIFTVLLAGLSILNLAAPTRESSENENRPLQQMPEFSAEALFNGKFTADFDVFVTDQFVFRDRWVGMKTLTEIALGRKSSNGVYFADDHYLIEMFDTVDSERYARNIEIVGEFTNRVQDGLGVPVYTMLVPTASMVLADKLPRNAPEVDQRALFMQAERNIPGFIDVSVPLGSHSGEYIYCMTDHHWTSLGAYYAYREWRTRIGEEAVPLDGFEQTVLSDSFYGTTYSKASLYNTPADTITAFQPKGLDNITVDYNNGEWIADSIYEPSFLESKDKYAVFLNANQPIIRIESGAGNGRHLLIVKDSYANAFVQMLLEDYERITILDLRYYKLSAYDYIPENGVTEALVLYNVKGFSGDPNLYYLST